MPETKGCFQSIKVKKFESNSQLGGIIEKVYTRCFQSIKVKKFESNSQPVLHSVFFGPAVFRVSLFSLDPLFSEYQS